MATFSELKTQVSRDLRDSSNNTWSTAEVGDLINQGIDALADFYPREIVQTVGTVSAGVVSYAASSYTNVYRLDVYTAGGEYAGAIPHGIGDGPDSGWEFHGGVLYLPPSWLPGAGHTLRAWGYGRYLQLSADSATTDVDAAGIWAVRVFCQAEGFGRLLADRAAFQQWQADPGNVDVTSLALNQLVFAQRRRWQEERQRLRRMRKLG